MIFTDCLGPSGSSITKSHAKCWFSGVYPTGTVHWLQGDVNLTESASTREEQDQRGQYNVSSTIDVAEGNPRQPYECSLWIPSAGKYLSSQQLNLPEAQKTPDDAGSMVEPQWICMMVEIMMVKFIMF